MVLAEIIRKILDILANPVRYVVKRQYPQLKTKKVLQGKACLATLKGHIKAGSAR